MTAIRVRALLLPAVAAVVVAVVALLVRGGAPAMHESRAAVSTVRSGHVTVAISNYAFSPDTLTVRAGTRITFTNHDSTAHTATANHGAFGTGTIQPGHSHTITVTKPGTDPYHCLFHAFMTGTITVVAR
jgi:plastocyanin